MEKIPIAIIGLNFGRRIVEDIINGQASEYIKLAAVCDMDEGKARDHADKYGVPCYTSLDDLLKYESIPAIGLYTGPAGRAKLLTKIIEAGKDVMTTKPFEVNCEDGLAVLKRAEELGRVIHMNSPAPCWSPDLQYVNEWQEKHSLGRLVGCTLSIWASYRDKSDGSWYDDPKLCPVAPIFRLGIYVINDLIRLFGEAEKVSVMHSRIFTERPTPDNALLSLQFKNGAVASVYASFCVKDGDCYRNSMTLNYENGTIYRNTGPVGEEYSTAHMSLVMGEWDQGRDVVEDEIAAECSGRYQWDKFTAAVRGEDIGKTTSAETVIAGLLVIEAMARAEQEGGVAKVRSVGELFNNQ